MFVFIIHSLSEFCINYTGVAAKSIHEFFWNFPFSLVEIFIWIGAKIWSIIPIDYNMLERAVLQILRLEIDWLYYASLLELILHGVVALSSTITIFMIFVVFIVITFFTKREERLTYESDQQVFSAR